MTSGTSMEVDILWDCTSLQLVAVVLVVGSSSLDVAHHPCTLVPAGSTRGLASVA